MYIFRIHFNASSALWLLRLLRPFNAVSIAAIGVAVDVDVVADARSHCRSCWMVAARAANTALLD